MIDYKFELTNLIGPLINLIKAARDEYKHANFIGLEDYLWNMAEKYYETNTFLHRDQKVKFMDIYYPLKISAPNSNQKVLPNFDFLNQHKYISIIGTAGSGKSMIMKSLFLESIEKFYRIPIFIELRRYNFEKDSFKKFIFNSILQTNLEPSESTLNRALKSGVYVFLFDGLDEISLDNKEHFICQLDEFVDSYYKNNFIISSRPRSGAEQLNRFEAYKVSEISENEYTFFIKKVVAVTERQENLLRVLSVDENKQYLHFFKNPLIFSMFILTFENHPEIPKKKSVFYQNVFDTLYDKHDGITKNSFIRNRKSKLQKDEFIELLSYFSAITFIQGIYYFTHECLFSTFEQIKKYKNGIPFVIEDLIADLDVSISILIKDGLEYVFPHRSIQEYFTALFIKNYIISPESKLQYIRKLIESSRFKSLDRHKSLWNLIYEMDRRIAYKYYLVPIYEEISNNNYIEDFSYENIFKYLDCGFYFIADKTKTPNIADIGSEKQIIKIKKAILEDLIDNCVVMDDMGVFNYNLYLEASNERRELKMRQVDSIYWDAVEIRLGEHRNRFIKSLNNSNAIEIIQNKIVNSLLEPIPVNFMISLKTILLNDQVVDTLDEIELNKLFVELLDAIKEDIKKMKKELETDSNELDFIFHK